jgi:YidC/Oxa1 family membrane protein insertase
VILLSPITPLENLLRHVLNWLHYTVGLPWAWSIVGLTVIVRLIIVPLTVRQIHSMQGLQRHAPEMKAIQQRYKHDKKKQNEELMKFYRENSINPAASCLPLLLQLPVFFSLYYVLRGFSRHPPPGDLSWLHVVPSVAAKGTAHWSGFLLLVIYAASQVASTLLMPTTMDKTQRNILLVMPLVFIFVIARFPTGLILYWMTTNLWTVGQGVITRRLTPKPAPPPKKTSRTPPKGGDGARPPDEQPQPAAPKPAAQQQPRRVRRKKGGARR